MIFHEDSQNNNRHRQNAQDTSQSNEPVAQSPFPCFDKLRMVSMSNHLSKGGNLFPSLWSHFPVVRQARGGADVQSCTAYAKQSIWTLAPNGGEGFKNIFSKQYIDTFWGTSFPRDKGPWRYQIQGTGGPAA